MVVVMTVLLWGERQLRPTRLIAHRCHAADGTSELVSD
jgi:hypothetical protein